MAWLTFNTYTFMITIGVRSTMILPMFLFVRLISRPPSTVVSLISIWHRMRLQLLPSAAMVRRFPLAAVNIRSINLMSHTLNVKMKPLSSNHFWEFGKDLSSALTLSPAGTSSSSTFRTLSTESSAYSVTPPQIDCPPGEFYVTTR